MRTKWSLRINIALSLVVLLASFAFAAHPLVTDDAGTMGKGNALLEINSEFTSDTETPSGVKTKTEGGEILFSLTVGEWENADIVLGVPYTWNRVKEDGTVTSDEEGMSDASLELKWRFYEGESVSLAVKPGLILPTGDEKTGLGNGRLSYSIFFIATKEAEPWAFHLNIGHTHNEYELGDVQEANREEIWHVSLAGEVAATENLTAVGNVGMERNPDKQSNTHPAFALAGIIYSLTENLDVDLGIKTGLTKPETDYTGLFGIAWNF